MGGGAAVAGAGTTDRSAESFLPATAGPAPETSTAMIGVPTSTVWPSCTSSRATVPSQGEGSSTTALAVSISTMIWLTSTWSPGLTCQATMSASVSPSPTSGSLNSLSSVMFAARPSVAGRAVDGVQDPVQVGQVVILEPRRRVGGGEPADPQDRRLQVVEALLGDPGGDLGTEAGVHRRLVRHHAAAGAAHRGADRLHVQRGQRAQVDDLDAAAVLAGGERRLQAGPDQRAVGQQRHVGPLEHHLRAV